MKGKIFNAQEVQSIIEGNKTMFREVMKSQPETNISPNMISFAEKLLAWSGGSICPYKVGQKIFVKETFAEVEVGAGMGYNSGKQTLYKAVDDYDVKWKPASHMKQEQSRLTLLVKEIRVERLGELVMKMQEKGMLKLSEVVKMKDGTNCYTGVWVVEFEVINN